MAVIYIKEQGTMIRKKGERVVVSKGTRELMEFPILNIDGIALIGNVQMTTQVLQFLLRQGVDITYYSYGGRYLGQTASESSKNIFLRLSQYEQYNDETNRLNFAKRIVENKIQNQLAVIAGHRWKNDASWKKDIEQMRKIAAKIKEAGTTSELLGIEGICSNIYFHSYGKMFLGDCEFHGRSRRPPKDPINAIISLGYTFLTKEIASTLEAESFEPYLGFLHGIRYGRKSLALDIIEEFRQPVVDKMTLKLFNKRMLSKYDFDIEGAGVLLNTEGFQKFCKEYEKWMDGREGGSEKKGFREIIRKQTAHLKHCLQNGLVYIPYRMESSDVCSKL